MSRRDHEQRPTEDRSFLGFRWRHLDLIGPDGTTFLRRRGIEHTRLGGVLIHFLDGPDPGLDPHNHPWGFTSIVLRGGYVEQVADVAPYRYEPGTWGAWLFDGEPDPDGTLASRESLPVRLAMEATLRQKAGGQLPHETHTEGVLVRVRTRRWRRWSVHRMPLDIAHRIVRVEHGTVTLVLRRPRVRRWGFFLPPGEGGWVDGEDYDYDARRPVSVVSDRPEEVRHG